LKQEEHGGGRPGLRSARNRVQGGSLAWSLREATEQLRHAVQVEVQAGFEHPRPALQRQIPQAIAGEPLGDQTIAVGPDGAVVVGHRIVARCGLVATVWTPQPVNDSGLRSIQATETSSARYATCRARPASGRRGGIATARHEGSHDHDAEQGGIRMWVSSDSAVIASHASLGKTLSSPLGTRALAAARPAPMSDGDGRPMRLVAS
jgi:hypothetical protein